MPAAPPLPTTITASTAGHVGHSNTVHDVVNAVYSSEFNVKAAPYGAVGDGVADDRAAIQAAVTAAGNAYAATGSPQTVRIPQGTFKVGVVNYISGDGSTQGITSIKLANGVNVTGSGTVKVAASAYGSGAWYRVFSSPDGVSTGTRLSNASITGITVDGNKANQVASQQCSNIELECASNVTIQDVKSVNANGNGIMLRGTAATNATNLRVVGCTVLNATCIGVQSSQFDGLIISDNYIDTTADNNIDIYGDDGTTTCHGKGFVIANNVCKNSGLVGIFPETVREGTITGNTIINPTDAGIHINRINGAPQAITVSGNTIVGGVASAFVSGDTNGVVFVGNTFRNFSAAGVQLGTGGGNVSRVAILNNIFDPPNATTYLIRVIAVQVAFSKSYGNIVIAGASGFYLSNAATTTVNCTFTAPIDMEA